MRRRPYYQPNPTMADLRGRRPQLAGQLGTWREQIDALDAEYQATGKEMRAWIEPCAPTGAQKDTAACKARRAFLEQVWWPLMYSWEVYRKNHEEWYEAPWTGTDVKAYRERLKQLRDRARGVGFVFASPEPVTPPDDSALGGIGKILKIAVVGGVIIGGVFILYKVLPPGQSRQPVFPRT